MIKDVNMQHMTMTEYVAVAMLSELATKEAVLKMITSGEATSSSVVETCFAWAEVFMKVREKRNAKTQTT